MARRRVSPSQAKAAVRRTQRKNRQAAQKLDRVVKEYNRKARSHNAKVKRSVDNYNREVRAYNNRRRRAIDEYNRAVQRYNQQSRRRLQTPARTAHAASAQKLQESFVRLESSGTTTPYSEVLDLAEREVANSADAFIALEKADEEESRGVREAEIASLQATTVTNELADFGADLQNRWQGALFALHPNNPDAARHFCASARETIGKLLELVAPDESVKRANPDYLKTQHGSVSRRARIHYCLNPEGEAPSELVDFVDSDITNVISLFDDFNAGTHGASGQFPLRSLQALKARVEQTIQFIYRLTQEPIPS